MHIDVAIVSLREYVHIVNAEHKTERRGRASKMLDFILHICV